MQFLTDDKGCKVAVQIDLKNTARKRARRWKRLRQISLNAAGCVNRYSVEVKPSARKELEPLPVNLLLRVVQKLEAYATPRRRIQKTERLQRSMAPSR